MIGTPPFMSPEQLTDARSVGPASDVFSLGALIVFAATGRGPFDADSPYLTAYQVVHDAPALDDVPDALRPVLARCLAKDPKERPEPGSLAAEFMAALPETGDEEASTVRLRAGELALVRTRPTGTPDSGFNPAASSASEPPARRRGRARRLWAVSGTAVALALGLTAYLLSGPGDDGRQRGTDAAAPSRWAAPPDGWRPWQTTVEAPAATGVKRAYDVAGVGIFFAPRCAVEGNAVFCAGDGTLPLRIDALTGRAVWRADGLPSAAGKGEFGFSVLGVVDGTVVVQQQYRADGDGEYRTSVTALDARTGKLLWHRGLNDSQTRAHLLGDLVVVPDDADGRTLVARSPRTGAERWTAALPDGLYCDWAGSGTDVPLVCGPGDEPAEHWVLLSLDATDGTAHTAEVPYDSAPVGSFDGRVLLLDRSEDEERDAYVRIRLVDTRTGRSTTTRLAHELEGDVTLADGVLSCASSSGPAHGGVGPDRRTAVDHPDQPGAALRRHPRPAGPRGLPLHRQRPGRRPRRHEGRPAVGDPAACPAGGEPGPGVVTGAAAQRRPGRQHLRGRSVLAGPRPPRPGARVGVRAGRLTTAAPSIRSRASLAKASVSLSTSMRLTRVPSARDSRAQTRWGGRCGSSSSRSRPCGRGTRSPCPRTRNGSPGAGPGSAPCRWPTW